MADGWADMEPVVRIVPRAKASISILKGGIAKVTLSFSETFYKEIGEPKVCDVQGGTGENAGKVRLVFRKEGKFSINELGKGGARVTLPLPEGAPNRDRDSEACEVISKSKADAIIALPLKAWTDQVAPKMVGAIIPKANGNGAAPGVTATQKFNVVEYLIGKGMKVTRDGDGYRVGREFESKASIVTIANRYRRAEGLPTLGVADAE